MQDMEILKCLQEQSKLNEYIHQSEAQKQGQLPIEAHTSEMLIKEALQLQLEIQKEFHEQVEVQKQIAQERYIIRLIEEKTRFYEVLSKIPGIEVSARSQGNSLESVDSEVPAPASDVSSCTSLPSNTSCLETLIMNLTTTVAKIVRMNGGRTPAALSQVRII